MNTVKKLTQEVVDCAWFAGEDAPLSATFYAGADESPILVIAGSNASGKSMSVKILAAFLHEEKIEPIQVSMRYRAGHNVSGIQRVMMFGSEDDESTGVISTSAVTTAFSTAKSREKPHWVMFDEPDIGLAEEYAIPMGRFIARHAKEKSDLTQGIVLVTHSKALISGLMRELSCQPHFLHMDGNGDLNTWLTTSTERSIEELESLRAKGRERWRNIEKFLKN